MKNNAQIALPLLLGLVVLQAESGVIYNNNNNNLTPYPNYMQQLINGHYVNGGVGGAKRRCPLCDSSVFSYCSDKLFHDSCCCSPPSFNPFNQLPYECNYADCSFLHANSCHEHQLISACCCTNDFRK